MGDLSGLFAPSRAAVVGATDRERAPREVAREYDIALVGPNCLGVMGQSGAFVTAVLDWAADQGIVGSDTLATIERTEAVIRDGRTREERTVDRMRESLLEHASVEGLLDARDQA